MIGFRSYSELAEVVFEPGVNVFLGRNEAGKSSILLAIQAALYPPRLATEREPLVSEEGIEVGDGSDLVRSLNERVEVLVSGSPGGVGAAKAVSKLETRVKELSGQRVGLVVAAEAKQREARETLERARAGARRL